MPPWHADAPHGHVPQRTRADRRREEDAPRLGRPAARRRATRRTCRRRRSMPKAGAIGKPDVVLEMQEDVQGPGRRHGRLRVLLHPDELHRAEVRAGDRSAPGQPRGRASCAGVLPGEAGHAAHAGAEAEPRTDGSCRRRREQATAAASVDEGMPSRLLGTYAPGTNPQVFRPGTALRLEPGGIIELQMHYTPTARRRPTARGSASSSRRIRRRAKSAPSAF